MSMRHSGLAKLSEELGELQQVIGKMLQYDNVPHPDGGPPLRQRLCEEISDVTASIRFVLQKHDILTADITPRALEKLALYRTWDKE